MLTWSEYVALARVTAVSEAEAGWQPTYNAAPSQMLPVVRQGIRGRELAMLRWGLVPKWSNGQWIINAQADGIEKKSTWAGAFRDRRCLILADSFYEWQKSLRQPYRFTIPDKPMAFAGLWQMWPQGEGKEPEEAFVIITTAPNELVAPLHNRMPAIIDPENYDAWLESRDTTIPLALLQPYPAERMTAYPVSTRVNSPKNNDATLLDLVSA